ncbi:MAG: hypothetical protein KAX80_15530, partial [Planctomycetes bacterium]|nr:hypothetical protein [Planctomycetota bacterium]
MTSLTLMERMFNFSQNISIASIATSAEVVLLTSNNNPLGPTLTSREAHLKEFLEDMDLTVEVRPWIEARRYDFSASRLVVYTEDLRIGTDTHTKIIDMGLGLAMFYTGGIGAGGNWYSRWADSTNWYMLTASPGGGYLDGYNGMSIQILDERQTIYR